MESNKDDKYRVSTVDALAYIADFLENETGSSTTEESVIMVCNKDIGGDITLLTATCSTSEDIDGLWSIHKETFHPSVDSPKEMEWSDTAFERIADNLKRISESVVTEFDNIEWIGSVVFDQDDEDE